MAFQEVMDLNCDTTTAIGGVNRKTNKPNPKSLEGYYLGKRQVEDKKKKTGVSYIYVLQTSKGNVGVWGKTDLDRKMTAVTPGAMIRITHSGMQATPNGEMYKYKVEVDRDNCIDVGDIAGAGEEPAEQEESYQSAPAASAEESYEDEGLTDEEEEPADEAPPARPSAPARPVAKVDAAAAAKARALLGRGRAS
jgi:hypothetical protein